MSSAGKRASYDLTRVQALVQEGNFVIRGVALDHAFLLGFDRYDIVACVLALDDSDFVKTMSAEQCPGLMQDVYKPIYLGLRMYVKVQLAQTGSAVVVQFKEA